MGTLLGTMCGFVSAVLLTPSQGGSPGGLPAAPGVVSLLWIPWQLHEKVEASRSTCCCTSITTLINPY